MCEQQNGIVIGGNITRLFCHVCTSVIIFFAINIPCPGTVFVSEKAQLKAVTVIENYPYSFVDKGVIQGLGIDVMTILADRAGFELSIEAQPATRALISAKTLASVLVLNLAKTPEREPLYYWIGPVSSSDVWLYKFKSRRDVQVRSMEDVKHYLVGVAISDATIPVLQQYGIRFDVAPSDLSNCRKFKIGRFELITVNPKAIREFLSACGIEADQVEQLIKFPLDNSIYFGLSKHTPIEVVNKLNTEMEGMKKDQTLYKINSKWKIY